MASPSASVQHQLSSEFLPQKGSIDRVHLARQCLGDEGLEQEVLRLFDTTIKTYFARLQWAEDAAGIRLALHTLKGASSGVGAWTIADLAHAAEQELGDADEIGAERLADLAMAIEEVVTFVAEILVDEIPQDFSATQAVIASV